MEELNCGVRRVMLPILLGSELAPREANAGTVLDFADGALNPALDQRDVRLPFEMQHKVPRGA